jgi:hypothetical protein
MKNAMGKIVRECGIRNTDAFNRASRVRRKLSPPKFTNCNVRIYVHLP